MSKAFYTITDRLIIGGLFFDHKSVILRTFFAKLLILKAIYMQKRIKYQKMGVNIKK